MSMTRRRRAITGRTAYGVTCFLAAVVLMVSGYAHKAVGLISETANGIAISGASSAGAMNILVMGLESRTNYQGQTLSSQLLTAMHAGSVYGVNSLGVGAQDTNTLILIHIFAGGQRAVGFSVPRDDLVTFPHPYLGYTQGKIDAAYDFAYNQSLDQTVNSSLNRQQRYLKANQAGQAATIATVESVTGVHIDHFVEANLAGFFYLARDFGGIEVCLKSWNGGQNLHDANSGFNAPHAGYLHLAADQALAFVRERDNLPDGDFDRTRRQQAVIDYVIWKLRHENAFSDLSVLNGLLSDASQYLITDSTLNLLDFATNMRALSGKNLTFQTLPGTPESNVPLNGSLQDVNVINVAKIRQVVKNAFYPQPAGKKAAAAKPSARAASTATPVPAPAAVTVDVYNGGTTAGLAAQVSQALAALGYQAGAVGNAPAQSQPVAPGTQVFYGAGTSANAAKIAAEFSTTARAMPSLPAGHVEILLGSASAAVPAGLSSSGGSSAPAPVSAAPATPSASPSATSATTSGSGTGGPVITVSPGAEYGIPCVY